jgi:hypothetical protein
MAGMYPENQTVSLFGKEVSWPGLDPATGKFTNGDFNNPLVSPSFIPAETINLILDNLAVLIAALGKTPNNVDTDQLLEIVSKSYMRERCGPGIICFSALNPVEQALRRILPLEGQVISVALYQDLCQCVYVGDASNETAPAFYRTEDSGGATRNTAGSYMVLPDARGIFLRGSGQQSRTISWLDSQNTQHTVDTLYDGKSIGEFISDRSRNITGRFAIEAAGGGSFGVSYQIANTGAFYTDDYSTRQKPSAQTAYQGYGWFFDASRGVPTGPDNAPASGSYVIGITY